MVEKKKIVRSVSSMGLCSGVTALLSIVQLSIVARFLTPEDYGTFAIPSIIVGAAGAFLAGVPLAVIQRDEVTKAQLASMQGWLYLFAVLLMLISCVLSWLVYVCGGAYVLLPLTAILSSSLLITSSGLLHQVWVRRELRMEKIAGANVASALVGALVAIVLAWRGFAFWALAYATVIRGGVTIFVLRYFSGLKLGVSCRLSEARSYLGFGLSRGADQFISQFTDKLDQLVIGSIMGRGDLGVYTVASNVARRPADLLNPVFGGVLFPLYSRMRSQPDVMRQAYEDSLQMLSIVLLGGASLVSLLAPEVVRILLGERWEMAIPLLRVIPFLFALRLMEVPCRQIANAAGASMRLLLWNLISAGVLGASIAMVALAGFGIWAVAVVALLARAFLFFIAFYVLVAPNVNGWQAGAFNVAWRVAFPVLTVHLLYFCFPDAFYGVRHSCVMLLLVLLSVANYKFTWSIASKVIHS